MAGAAGGVSLETSNFAEQSFNSEVLESQNSAENLRLSMNRYLHNKHQHLVKVSEQLASRNSGHAYFGGVAHLAPGATYDMSHFRSLEDINERTSSAAAAAASSNDVGQLLDPRNSSRHHRRQQMAPLQTSFLYNSDSNLNAAQAVAAAAVAAAGDANNLMPSDGSNKGETKDH